MKYVLILVVFTVFVFGCSKKAEKESESKLSEQPQESNAKAVIDRTELLNYPSVKEQLFFYIRDRVLDLDEQTFVKFEDLQIDDSQFQYTSVIVDHEMMHYEAKGEHANLVHLVNYTSPYSTKHETGDTVIVRGVLVISDLGTETLEGSISSVTLNVSGEVETSFLNESPYSYGGFERSYDGYDISEELVVKLNEPLIYRKETLYLKARIQLLSKVDLRGLTNDELSYLRNEIFARHGHSFKTEKMQDYFRLKKWYVPYFDDATPFLNEFEKENALFIKSLES
ncbi:MAG: YARHG domain-containing protein [Marinoscillum sp.]